MKIVADLSKGTLIVNDLIFHISCKIRTIRDGTRASYEVIRTVPHCNPYDPQPFPKGVWNITGVQYQKEKGFDPNTYGPVKIVTDAVRTVTIWQLDENGDYLREANETTVDKGYLLHYSTSSTTLGCIRLASPQDAIQIAEIIQKTLSNNEPVQLEVV